MGSLGENIRALRKAYGETQLDLSLILNQESTATISNYESGIREPKHEVIKKIAEHYRVTEEELFHGDFSQLSFPKTISLDAESQKERLAIFLPIVSSPEAMRNPDFKRGYEAHCKFIDISVSGESPGESIIETCIESYDKAAERDVIEAVANCLSIFVMLEYGIVNSSMLDSLGRLAGTNEIELLPLIREHFLSDPDFDEFSATENAENDEQHTDITNVVTELIRELSKSSQYHDLADYYIAYRYLNGLVTPDTLSVRMNISVGAEMMFAFALAGNKYALNYLRYGVQANRDKRNNY